MYRTCIAAATCIYFHVLPTLNAEILYPWHSPELWKVQIFQIQIGSSRSPLCHSIEQQSSAKDHPDWKVKDRTFHRPRVFQVWDKKMSMPETFTNFTEAQCWGWTSRDRESFIFQCTYITLISILYCLMDINSHEFRDWEVWFVKQVLENLRL